MRSWIVEAETDHSPLTLARQVGRELGVIVLQSALWGERDRFSFVVARPFARLEVRGNCCCFVAGRREFVSYGNPWAFLEERLLRYELLEEVDLPFPLGGVFGYWGYELNRQLTKKLASKAARKPEVPDLCVGFYDSLCIFDHCLEKCWVVSTGIRADGSRSVAVAREKAEWWLSQLRRPASSVSFCFDALGDFGKKIRSNLSRAAFMEQVNQAKLCIRAGDIYQVNLSHRLALSFEGDGFEVYRRLAQVSPAPLASWMNLGQMQIASASPESFLRISGRHVRTRPIKGTRPRSADAQRDAQLAYELQSSPKELAELVMITDLLRNDLGQICEFGSVIVSDLARLERYPQVQHLVSTVEGVLCERVSHVQALAACFPGGSVTGTPKLRAMQIIDELEPIARGPYTGALGFIGFNRETHLSIGIRTAFRTEGHLFFNVGAGIVADSDPAAEYEETMDKARGFLEALSLSRPEGLSQKPYAEQPPAPVLSPHGEQYR